LRKIRRLDPSPLSELLPGVLRGLMGARGWGIEKVRAAWGDLVGPAIAKRTRVKALEQGQVRVEVASAALKHDLATFRRPALLKGLQARLPELSIRALTFRVGSIR
jgi:hypothetical protein